MIDLLIAIHLFPLLTHDTENEVVSYKVSNLPNKPLALKASKLIKVPPHIHIIRCMEKQFNLVS